MSFLWWRMLSALCVFIWTISAKEIEKVTTAANTTYRVGFGSCYNVNSGRGEIWKLLQAQQLQQFISLGDLIYADFDPITRRRRFGQGGLPEEIAHEYKKLSEMPSFVDFANELTPFWKTKQDDEKGHKWWYSDIDGLVVSDSHASRGFLMTYDDHDYGVNNGDRNYIHRDAGMSEMRKFVEFVGHFQPPQVVQLSSSAVSSLQAKNVDVEILPISSHDPPTEVKDSSTVWVDTTKDGVYSSHLFSIGIDGTANEEWRYKLILLDSRSQKDPSDVENGSFLGPLQWKWLEEELSVTRLEQEKVSFIIIGVSIQVLPDDKLVEENWSEFPHERKRLLDLLASLHEGIDVIILSGDIHSAEINQAYCQPSDATHVVKDNELRLIEFTSSGLSHTLPTVLPSVDDPNYPSPVYGEDGVIQLPESSRGWLYEATIAVYQKAYPAYFREEKYGHSLFKLHIGVLEFQLQPSFDGHPGDPRGELTFRAIDGKNHIAMEKSITLRKPDYEKAKLAEGKSYECVPYWGIAPTWSRSLMFVSVASVLLIVLVLPALGVIWLVLASLWYLFIGHERKRRIILENQSRSKQD